MRISAGVATHWPEYLMEAAGIGCFMISACVMTALVEYPGSPVRQLIPGAFWRRVTIGVAMGSTAIAIIYSPWGRRSGAHLNPSVTLAFFMLGKIHLWDAFFYVVAQFAGGVAGVTVSSWLLGGILQHATVNYAVTAPGGAGVTAAFLGELTISIILMLTVLIVSNTKKLTHLTGLFAGALVAAFITLEAPLSGMSMNPARTFGSALPAHQWTAWWLYFTAPPLGMLIAACVYRVVRGIRATHCAKLVHPLGQPCIFLCNFGDL